MVELRHRIIEYPTPISIMDSEVDLAILGMRQHLENNNLEEVKLCVTKPYLDGFNRCVDITMETKTVKATV